MGRLWEVLRHKASGPFYTEPRDERKSRRKPWRFSGAWAVTSARSAGGFRSSKLTLFRRCQFRIGAVYEKKDQETNDCGIPSDATP